ncbi:MAG TPA: hypothetical protein VHU24_03145 [Solirubrobacterales bacterium]|jgi:hypothetical protein|nr:hypothetical protein [Solirubrobacterales bacterium]
MQATRARAGRSSGGTTAKASERQLVEKIFEEYGLPGWLGWGTYGAESTYGQNGAYKFGGIDLPNGTTTNLTLAAGESAKLYASLVKQYGSVAAAVPHYSGNSYTVGHVRSLAQGGGQGHTLDIGLFEGLEEFGQLFGGKGPGNLTGPGSGKGDNPLGEAGQGAIGAISSLSGLIEFLTSGETWLRLGEILAGALLIFLGLKGLAGVDLPTAVPVPV